MYAHIQISDSLFINVNKMGQLVFKEEVCELACTPNSNEKQIPSQIFSKDDIPMGTCTICQKKQTNPGEGGFWISQHAHTNPSLRGVNWYCRDCKYKHNVKSYPVQCESCTYQNVKWCQGHAYNCPRCEALKIN